MRLIENGIGQPRTDLNDLQTAARVVVAAIVGAFLAFVATGCGAGGDDVSRSVHNGAIGTAHKVELDRCVRDSHTWEEYEQCADKVDKAFGARK